MTHKTARVIATLTPGQKRAFRALCRRNGTSMSEQVTWWIRDALTNDENGRKSDAKGPRS